MKISTLATTIAYLIYRLIIDIIYVNWQSSIYDYIGFDLNPDIWKILFSYFILIVFLFLIPKSEKSVSYLVMQLHFIIMIIPLTSIYAFANFSTNYMLMVSFVFIVQILLVKYTPNIALAKIKGIKYIVIATTTTLTLSTYSYLLLTQPIHLNVLSLEGVYDIRDDQTLHFPFSYIIVWQYRIINPILIALFFQRKKWFYMTLIAGAQILLYMMYPHKEVFFSVGLLVFLLFLYKRKIIFSKIFTIMLTVGVFISVLIYELFSNLMPFGIIASRLLFGPARNKFQHYDFFSQTDKIYFSDGLIGRLLGLEYPYPVSVGKLIGSAYGIDSNSNTGYLASSYVNLGFMGMLLMSLLLVLLLKIFDSQTKNYDPKFLFVLIAYPMLILNDGDLLTSMLTGGLILIVILFFSLEEFVDEKLISKKNRI